jgi:hypothetical protein
MRLSRPCYDKVWRCPGWAGGGMRYAVRQRCDNGTLRIGFGRKWWKFRFYHCDTCDVLVLPYVIRYVDWRDWKWQIGFWWRYRRN